MRTILLLFILIINFSFVNPCFSNDSFESMIDPPVDLVEEVSDSVFVDEQELYLQEDKEKEEKTESKKPKREYLKLSIDSEYNFLPDGTSNPVSIQGIFRYKQIERKILVLNSLYQDKLDKTLLNTISQEKKIDIYFDDFKDLN